MIPFGTRAGKFKLNESVIILLFSNYDGVAFKEINFEGTFITSGEAPLDFYTSKPDINVKIENEAVGLKEFGFVLPPQDKVWTPDCDNPLKVKFLDPFESETKVQEE